MSYYVITPHLPKRKVGLMAIGKRYAPRLAAPLEKLGVDVLWLPDAMIRILAWPDMPT